MTDAKKNSLIGIIFIICATFLLSFRSILVKLAYGEGILVMDLLYYRFLLTVPLLILFAIAKKGKTTFTTIFHKKIFINCIFAGFFGYYLATLTDFYSLKLINANINRIIVYTFPIYVLFLNAFIHKKLPNKQDIILFLLIQIGLFFTLGGFGISLQKSDILGILLALAAAISYSVYIIINQQIAKKIGSVLFTTYAIIFSFIFINIHFLFIDNNNISYISNKGIIIIITMSIFCTFLPLLLISEAIKKIGANRFALLNSSGPIITIFFCFLILEEIMTYQQVFGAITVLVIIFISEKIKNKKISDES